MEDLASTVFDHEKTIQDSERKSWYGEEVHGRDGLAVIPQESSPQFPCLLGRKQAVEIARNCAFRDVKAQFQKLTVNSGSAPGGILVRDSPDKSSHLGIDLGLPRLLGRDRRRGATKASPMPSDNGFWFDNNQGVAPCGP
jgi:hypothetical protein